MAAFGAGVVEFIRLMSAAELTSVVELHCSIVLFTDATQYTENVCTTVALQENNAL